MGITRSGILLLLALPLMADTITAGSSEYLFFTTPCPASLQCFAPESGVDQEYYIGPDGSVNWWSGFWEEQGSWGIAPNVNIPLPLGSTINSATLTFSNVIQNVFGYGVATSSLTGATFNACDNGVGSGGPFSGAGDSYGSIAFQFATQCAGRDAAFSIYFGGDADLQYAQGPIPPGTEGYYEQDAQLLLGIDYAVTVDYSTAAENAAETATGDATPEPASVWLVALGIGMAAARRFRFRVSGSV